MNWYILSFDKIFPYDSKDFLVFFLQIVEILDSLKDRNIII